MNDKTARFICKQLGPGTRLVWEFLERKTRRKPIQISQVAMAQFLGLSSAGVGIGLKKLEANNLIKVWLDKKNNRESIKSYDLVRRQLEPKEEEAV